MTLSLKQCLRGAAQAAVLYNDSPPREEERARVQDT